MHLYAVQSTMHNCTLPVGNVSSGLHLMVVHSRPPHCTHSAHSAQSVGPLDPAWPAVQLLAASLSWVLQPSLAVSWFLLTISSPHSYFSSFFNFFFSYLSFTPFFCSTVSSHFSNFSSSFSHFSSFVYFYLLYPLLPPTQLRTMLLVNSWLNLKLRDHCS